MRASTTARPGSSAPTSRPGIRATATTTSPSGRASYCSTTTRSFPCSPRPKPRGKPSSRSRCTSPVGASLSWRSAWAAASSSTTAATTSPTGTQRGIWPGSSQTPTAAAPVDAKARRPPSHRFAHRRHNHCGKRRAMTTDSLEPFEGNGNDVPRDAAAAEPPVPAVWIPPEVALIGDALSVPPPPPSRRWFRRGLPRERALRVASRRRRLVGFVVAFTVGAAAVIALVCGAASSLSNTYRDRVLPGVRVGSVDLSGLTRDQAMAKLQSDYAYLGNGLITITTPVGTATITYQQAGRGPDVEAMADAAMTVGHSGDPLADGASVVHSAAFGQDIPIVVQIDPTALAERIHVLNRATSVAAKDAQATNRDGNFSFTAGAGGASLDETAMGSTIIDQLNQAGAASNLQTSGRFVTLEPRVSDKDAMDAIARAWKMVASVDVTWAIPPAGAPSSWRPQDWKISTDQIRGWIVFGIQPDGTYAPTIDRAQMEAYLAGVPGTVDVAPVEPGIVWDASGKPVDLTAGKDGLGVDPV